MTAALRPTSELVAVGWLTLALPAVGVGTRLPAADAAMRQNGFVRVAVVGGTPDVYAPRRVPVVVAECWVPPADGSHLPPWNRAGEVAEQVLAATFDPSLANRTVDLSGVGDYAPARVLTVTALQEPRRVDGDPNFWARHELDLSVAWVPTT